MRHLDGGQGISLGEDDTQQSQVRRGRIVTKICLTSFIDAYIGSYGAGVEYLTLHTNKRDIKRREERIGALTIFS